MQILLTGKTGQVGFELQRALAPLGHVIAVNREQLDLSNQTALRQLIREIRPNIIVNPAAFTAVDKAESQSEMAFAVNGIAPGVLGEEAAKLDALVVHYSTDYVFDGTKQTLYTEEDIPNPLNVYGKSKLTGEQTLRVGTEKHLIFRTSWVFGAHGCNFTKTMLKLAMERETLNVVADQFGAPTSASLIADVTAQIVGQYQRQRQSDFPFGIYNLVAAGETTWCDYATSVIVAAHRAGKVLKLKPENVCPISTKEYPLPAPRPANSRLATRKLKESFDLYLPSWQEGLEHVLQQLF